MTVPFDGSPPEEEVAPELGVPDPGGGMMPPAADPGMAPPGPPPGPPLPPPDQGSLVDALDSSESEPGTAGEVKLILDDEQVIEIGNEIVEQLTQHDSAWEKRWKMMDRIADAYVMKFDKLTGGLQPNAAMATSEYTKNFCDQASARIAGQFLGADPLFHVVPIGEGSKNPLTQERQIMADALVEFLHNYCFDVMRLKRWFRSKLKRAVKYGCAATRDMWAIKTRSFRYYDEGGSLKEEFVTEGKIVCHHIHYRDLILWPTWIDDWQEDYEMVGHRARYSPWKFREKARKWGVPEDEIEEIITAAKGLTSKETERSKRHGIDGTVGEEMDNDVEVAEVWVQGAPKGLAEDKYQFIVQEDTRKLLFWNYNSLNCQKHPYFPTVYKEKDGLATGEGVGEEVAPFQRADSALYNLEIDNAKVIGNSVIAISDEANVETMIDDLWPGRRITVSGNPHDMIAAIELGAPIDLIHAMQDRTYRRAVASTGMSALLQGMGDPVMKSGQDVGTSLALIEEGAKKFGDVDDYIKEQFAEEVVFWVELLQQYAPDGVFFNKASEEHAQILQIIKYIPPRERLEDVLKIDIVAPSAATNKAVQRQQLMLMLQLSQSVLDQFERLGTEIYESEGLHALIIDLKRQVLEYHVTLYKLVLDSHDVIRLKSKVPGIRPPLPPDIQISVLMQRIQELEFQLDELSAQIPQEEGFGPETAPSA